VSEPAGRWSTTNFLFPTAHLCSAARWGKTTKNNSSFSGRAVSVAQEEKTGENSLTFGGPSIVGVPK
jgi:hypothetical protein